MSRSRLVAAGVALAALCVYLPTVCRTVSPVSDAGELTAAAITLGIPHAPGYPFFVLLGHLFSWLPVQPPALAINLMAAMLGALAAAVACLAFVELGLDLLQAAVAALLLATSMTVWQVSLSGEFRSLELLSMVTLAYLVFRWFRAPSPGMARAMALLFGLGLTIHYSFAILIAVTVVVLAVWGRASRPAWPPFWQLVGLFVLGLTPFLYLPIRAAQHPFLNWGSASTWAGLLWDLGREGYGGITQLKSFQQGDGTGLMLKDLAVACWTHFTPVGLVLVLIGFTQVRRAPRQAWWLGLCMLLCGPLFIIWQHPFNDPDFWGGLERQLLGFWLGYAGFAALGLQAVSEVLKRVRLEPALLLLVAVPLWWNRPLVDLHRETIADCYGHDLLDRLAPHAALFISTDPAYSATTYEQAVAQVRPDVLIVGEPLLGSRWYEQQLLDRHPDDLAGFDFASLAKSGDPNPLIDWLIKKRPVYVDNPWPSIQDRLMEQGVVYQVAPKQDDILHFDPLTYLNRLDHEVAVWRSGSLAGGLDRYDAEASYIRFIQRQYALGYTNLAVALGRRGWDQDTMRALQSALDLDPHSALAHKNLGYVYYSHGQLEDALNQYRQAAQYSPTDADVYRAMAGIFAKMGNSEEATRCAEEAQRLSPDTPSNPAQ